MLADAMERRSLGYLARRDFALYCGVTLLVDFFIVCFFLPELEWHFVFR